MPQPSSAVRTPAPGQSNDPAVVFDRVSIAFDESVVLRDVSFQVPRGTMRILLGASGSGKWGRAEADPRAAASVRAANPRCAGGRAGPHKGHSVIKDPKPR